MVLVGVLGQTQIVLEQTLALLVGIISVRLNIRKINVAALKIVNNN